MWHSQSKKPIKGSLYCSLSLQVAIVILLAGCTESPKALNAPSAPPKPVQKQAQPITSAPTPTVEEKPVPVYSYVPAGRRDPFAPIIVKETKKGKIGDRPPLERYNLEEFKLSGIVWGGFGYNAILEGPDGKGYFVRVGSVLGPNGGIIKKITQKTLVVEERFKNYAGESERREIVKQLQAKQEEKP